MIELMITVVFVTLGSLLIQGSFMRAANMFGRYSHTLSLMDWMDQESAKAKETLLYSKESELGNENGTLTIDGKSFSWSRAVEPLETPNLSLIRYSANWTESGKPMEHRSELYVYKKDISQNL